jgi:hypothetical protein
VFTARYGPSPYIKETLLVFKGLSYTEYLHSSQYVRPCKVARTNVLERKLMNQNFNGEYFNSS